MNLRRWKIVIVPGLPFMVVAVLSFFRGCEVSNMLCEGSRMELRAKDYAFWFVDHSSGLLEAAVLYVGDPDSETSCEVVDSACRKDTYQAARACVEKGTPLDTWASFRMPGCQGPPVLWKVIASYIAVSWSAVVVLLIGTFLLHAVWACIAKRYRFQPCMVRREVPEPENLYL